MAMKAAVRGPASSKRPLASKELKNQLAADKPRDNPLERLGKRGGMNAAAGGSMMVDGDTEPSRTKVRFRKGQE